MGWLEFTVYEKIIILRLNPPIYSQNWCKISDIIIQPICIYPALENIFVVTIFKGIYFINEQLSQTH